MLPVTSTGKMGTVTNFFSPLLDGREKYAIFVIIKVFCLGKPQVLTCGNKRRLKSAATNFKRPNSSNYYIFQRGTNEG